MATAKQLAALKKGREAMAKKRAAGTVKKRVAKKVKAPAKKKVVRKIISDNYAIKIKLGNQTAYLKDTGLNKFDTEIKNALVVSKTTAKNLVEKLNRKHGDKGNVSFRIVAAK